MEEKGLIYVIASTLATRIEPTPNCEQQGSQKNELRFRAWAGRCLWDAGLAASLSPLYSGDVSRCRGLPLGISELSDNRWKYSEGCSLLVKQLTAKSSADPHDFLWWAVRDFSGVGEGCSTVQAWRAAPIIYGRLGMRSFEDNLRNTCEVGGLIPHPTVSTFWPSEPVNVLGYKEIGN